MNGPVYLEVPEPLRLAIAESQGEAALPRWGLEALVVEALRERMITRGYAGEILGLSFHEREKLFAERGVSYDISIEELERQQCDLGNILNQK